MYEYHILNAIRANERHTIFHMPGHKTHVDFTRNFPVAQYDITELSYSDNLLSPEGAILKAQEDIARIVGAKKCFITTDGSTSGVYAFVYVASLHGSKIIVPRNSHKSVFAACKLFKLEPVIVQGEERDGILLPPAPEEIETLIVNDVTISGLLAVSPDYFGNIAPLKEYSEILKRNNRLLFVDGAHGAHLAFEPERAGYAGLFADIWVDGAHKTLATLTQGAYVLCNNEKLFDELNEGITLFRTTSPSYPVMASVEYGVKHLANNTQLSAAVKEAREKLKEELAGLEIYPSADWTKLVIDFENSGISPDKAQKKLEDRGIYPEFSSGRHMLFYLSPYTPVTDIKALKKHLLSLLKDKNLKSTYKKLPDLPRTERTYSYLYALKKEAEYVPLNEAMGRMAAQNAGITPPCTPVIIAGEMISAAAVELLTAAPVTFGLNQGKISVVK